MPIDNIGVILASRRQIGGDQTETAVAKAFLAQHALEYDSVEFEVHLGPGITLDPAAPEWLQKCATVSTQLRADMVLYRGNYATIVEVKGRLGPPAIGQLLTYARLLRSDRPDLLQVYKIAAGQSIQAGMTDAFNHWGIEVELFPGTAIGQTTTL